MLQGVSGTGLIGEFVQNMKDMEMASVARLMRGPEVSVDEAFFSKLKDIITAQGYKSGN